MGNYAIIENGIVSNIVVSRSPKNGNWIQYDDLPVHIGDSYDGAAFYRDGVRVMTAEEEYAQALSILLGGDVYDDD